MEQTQQITVIANKITELRNQGLSDKAIDQKILQQYDGLEFGLCRKIDMHINPNQYGGYWRDSFNNPNLGDEVRLPKNMVYEDCDDESETLGIVTKCGFFTMEITWQG